MMAMVEGKIVAIDVKSGQNNILPYLLLPLLLLLLLSVHCNLTANIADTCLLVFIVGCWAFTVSDIVIRELVVVVGFLNCRINLFAAAHKLATFLIKLSSFVCLLVCLCVCVCVCACDCEINHQQTVQVSDARFSLAFTCRKEGEKVCEKLVPFIAAYCSKTN